jgi:hypothetical protein
MPRISIMPSIAIVAAALIAVFADARAHAQTTLAPETAPPAGATDQAPVVVPSAPPGIYVTPSTRPMFRPPVQRDQDSQPPVEGCPAGDNRKLELLV